METVLIKQQKTEALNRLKILQDKFELMETVSKEFENKDIVYYSKYNAQTHQGVLYEVSSKEKYIKIIKELEEKKLLVVYHAIEKTSIFGTELILLYVSKYKRKWEDDKCDLRMGIPSVYSINITENRHPNLTRTQIISAGGGITRVE